jgi:hypothetical protein
MAQKKIIQQALAIMGERFVEVLQNKIIEKGLFKSGNLASSVSYAVNDDNLSVSMADYGFYQDSGVKGTKGWKNPRTNQTYAASGESLFAPGQFKSKAIGGPLPLPVRFSIAKYGIQPRPFILDAYVNNASYIEEPLIDGIEEQVTVDLVDIAKKHGAKIV